MTIQSNTDVKPRGFNFKVGDSLVFRRGAENERKVVIIGRYGSGYCRVKTPNGYEFDTTLNKLSKSKND
jgi:hypothetical protein